MLEQSATMRRIIVIVCIFAAVLLVGVKISIVRASEADDQKSVTEKFIMAYFLQDMKTVRECLPDNVLDLFNPYPLTSSPKYMRPKVHDNQALLEFTGTTADNRFFTRGGIVFYKHKNIWYVRQVLFYNTIPVMFGMPDHSITPADCGWEPKVLAVGSKFMSDWKDKNTAGMMAVWHNWPGVDRDPVKGLTLRNFTATVSMTHWKDPLVTYNVDASYKFGFLTYRMRIVGGLVLVKEGSGWKVRANNFLFDF